MIYEITAPKMNSRNKTKGMRAIINLFGCDSYHLSFKGKIIQKNMGPKKIKKNPIPITPLVKRNDSPAKPPAKPSNTLPAIQSARPSRRMPKPIKPFQIPLVLIQ